MNIVKNPAMKVVIITIRIFEYPLGVICPPASIFLIKGYSFQKKEAIDSTKAASFF